MTRLLLTSIVFAILQLGVPHQASAAGLRPGGESTHVVPRLEVLSNGVFARSGSRLDDLRITHTTPCAPAALARLHRIPAGVTLPAREAGGCDPVALSFRLPDARAPPA